MGRMQPLRFPGEVHGLLCLPGLHSDALTILFLLSHSTTSHWKEKCFTGSRWPLSSKPPAIESPLKSSPRLPHAGCCWWTLLTAMEGEHGTGPCGAASA